MVTKKSKRFIKALQSFCMIDNMVIEKKIKERRVMNKRRGLELIGIGCVSILLAGTGFFFLQQKQNAVQVEAFDEEEALPEENQLILDTQRYGLQSLCEKWDRIRKHCRRGCRRGGRFGIYHELRK